MTNSLQWEKKNPFTLAENGVEMLGVVSGSGEIFFGATWHNLGG